MNEFCLARLDSAIAEILFRRTSVGAVLGLRLEDGRRVVVKVHQPRQSRRLLEDTQRVQAHLCGEGFPCPQPLVGPTPLGRGLAVAEELVDVGVPRDTHDPAHRQLMAETLAWHLELTHGCLRLSGFADGWSMYSPDQLWPRQAHAPIFDFDATAEGAEWIDAIAARAKPLATEPGEPIVGHQDWSGKHFRFAENRVTVIYDWDSLALSAETATVGHAAMTFTANFDLPGIRLAPSPAEARAFIDEYAAARQAPLDRTDRQRIAASATFVLAYIARCEHCRRGEYDAIDGPDSFTRALATYGEQYLVP